MCEHEAAYKRECHQAKQFVQHASTRMCLVLAVLCVIGCGLRETPHDKTKISSESRRNVIEMPHQPMLSICIPSHDCPHNFLELLEVHAH